jgi:N-acetylglutamate synthase-like GNAT family acetyltransferase
VYELRRLRPEDAPGVRDCVTRVHGDGYPRSDLYSPEAIARNDAAGTCISVVAAHAGAVVGHMALEPSVLGRTAEMGTGVVLPEHRGHGLLERLRDLVVAEATRLGLGGQFVEIEVGNVAAQTLANRSPARPCGLTVGLWPGSPRKSYVRYFRYLDRPASVVLHAPPRHGEILARTYAQLGVAATLGGPGPPRQDHAMIVEARPSWGSIFARVGGVGVTTAAEIERFHAAFEADARFSAAFLELPMAQPATVAAVAVAERLGFFYGGVSPWGSADGDALALQRVKGDFAVDRLEPTHPFAQELRDWIVARRW